MNPEMFPAKSGSFCWQCFCNDMIRRKKCVCPCHGDDF